MTALVLADLHPDAVEALAQHRRHAPAVRELRRRGWTSDRAILEIVRVRDWARHNRIRIPALPVARPASCGSHRHPASDSQAHAGSAQYPGAAPTTAAPEFLMRRP